MSEKIRCTWCSGDPLYTKYHDEEWGVPIHDSQKLFEFLILEGAQAGLSWITILRRREAYREAYDNFDPKKIARWSEAHIEKLMQDKRIIRNRRKILSAKNNAECFLQMQGGGAQAGTQHSKDHGGDFSAWLWNFVDNVPIKNHFTANDTLPAFTPLSTKISDALKEKGFSFVGPTIIYAFMQAVGMVNDHVDTCFRA
ncbi:MAG: DNA-3-methyladenine glycosylase I [Termitinemataceae bacterium]|nr:MAG: DNA-3-methyladenine glycosylase I [Termitinemataceae bacterium]